MTSSSPNEATSPQVGRNFTTGSPIESRCASLPQFVTSDHLASSAQLTRITSHGASADHVGMAMPSHHLFSREHQPHQQQRHESNGFLTNTASPAHWLGDAVGAPTNNSDATWPWPSTAGLLSQSPSPPNSNSAHLLTLNPQRPLSGLMQGVGGNVHTPRNHMTQQHGFGDAVSPRRTDGRRHVDVQRSSARSNRHLEGGDYLEANLISREARLNQETPGSVVPPLYCSPEFSSGAYTPPSVNYGGQHQMHANRPQYGAGPSLYPYTGRVTDTAGVGFGSIANRPASGRAGAILFPSTPTAAASPTTYTVSPGRPLGTQHDYRYLMQRKWQNLNIILPLYVPGGTVVTTNQANDNTYVFPDSMPGAQLLFSSVGKVCDTPASYLRLRVAVIQKCPEFLVAKVVELFNDHLRRLNFEKPITLRCTGIGKHTINNNRSNTTTAPTYRYDTIGRASGPDDVEKMKDVLRVLEELQIIVNTDLKAALQRMVPTDAQPTELCGPHFKFSPCRELKISVREGSHCDSSYIDGLIASGAGIAAPWAQQFTVDKVCIAEIRVERDKRMDLQPDPFFKSDSAVINTRAMSCTDGPNYTEGRVVLAANAQAPPVHPRSFHTSYEAGQALYGCTYEPLIALLQSGRTATQGMAPSTNSAAVGGGGAQRGYYAIAADSIAPRCLQSTYPPRTPNMTYQRSDSQQQCPAIGALSCLLPAEGPPRAAAPLGAAHVGGPLGSPVLGGVVMQLSPRAMAGVATPVAFQPQTPHSSPEAIGGSLVKAPWLYGDLSRCNPTQLLTQRSPEFIPLGSGGGAMDLGADVNLLRAFNLGAAELRCGGSSVDLSADELIGQHTASAAPAFCNLDNHIPVQPSTLGHMAIPHSLTGAVGLDVVQPSGSPLLAVIQQMPHRPAGGVSRGLSEHDDLSLSAGLVASVQDSVAKYRDVISTTASAGADVLDFSHELGQNIGGSAQGSSEHASTLTSTDPADPTTPLAGDDILNIDSLLALLRQESVVGPHMTACEFQEWSHHRLTSSSGGTSNVIEEHSSGAAGGGAEC